MTNLLIDKTEKVSNSEEVKFVDLNICPEIITLFYLADITKLDLLTLTLLFEKLGTSLYYLFYMLAKRKISFPSESNLLKAIKFSETVEALDNNYIDINKIPQKDRNIFQKLVSSVVERKYIRIKVDTLAPITTSNMPSLIEKIETPVVKSELNSSIKKCIRKEKRKLDRIGQMYTLFEVDSPTRKALIEKVYNTFNSRIQPSDNIEDLREYTENLIDSYNK